MITVIKILLMVMLLLLADEDVDDGICEHDEDVDDGTCDRDEEEFDYEEEKMVMMTMMMSTTTTTMMLMVMIQTNSESAKEGGGDSGKAHGVDDDCRQWNRVVQGGHLADYDSIWVRYSILCGLSRGVLIGRLCSFAPDDVGCGRSTALCVRAETLQLMRRCPQALDHPNT